MSGFKQREIEMTERTIQRLLDAYSLEEILEYNDIPEQAVIEVLIETDYLSDDDLVDQLVEAGLLDDEIEEDDES